jgi:hypothetical protein
MFRTLRNRPVLTEIPCKVVGHAYLSRWILKSMRLKIAFKRLFPLDFWNSLVYSKM